MLCLVVEECKARLVAAGFSEIKESEPWDVKPKDKVQVKISYLNICICTVITPVFWMSV